MNIYRFDTLLNYVLKDLTFRSRVCVVGNWCVADDIPAGSRLVITFYFEWIFKSDTCKVEKLNNTWLLEGISFETRVDSIEAYRRMEKERENSPIEEKQCTLRNDFKTKWMLYNDQIVTLLDYLLCRVNLPRRCAVMVFGCKRTRYHGYYTEGNLDLLFAFPVVEKDLQRAVSKLKGRKLLPDTNLRIHCITFAEYEKFLSGELEYFPDEWKQTGIVLYDFFHRKRLRAEFIKRNRENKTPSE